MKRFSTSTVLKSKFFWASAACPFILLVFGVVSPRNVQAGVTQSPVYTNGISETFNGKTATLDLGACPQSICELRVGGLVTLNPGGFGHSNNGTIGQFSVTLRGGTDTFYFPAGSPNGLRQPTAAAASEDESRHDGYNHEASTFVLPPSGPYFTLRGEHIFLHFTSTSDSGGDLHGTANGTATFTATTGKKIAGLQMPGTAGLVGAGLMGLAGIFGVLTLKHIVAG